MRRRPDCENVSLRSLVGALYAPGAIYSIGQGAIVPVIALMARHVGASVALAGATVGLRGVGAMVGDIPAGAIVTRLGDRRAVVLATLVQIASSVAAATARTPWVLALAVFVSGLGWAQWGVARLSYATDVLPAGRRGQGIATLGGASRMGSFVGPLIGAGVIKAVGTAGAFWVAAAAASSGCALMMAATSRSGYTRPQQGHARVALRSVGGPNRAALIGPGLGAMVICALRTSRQALLPLWASHVGVDAAGVSLIFGLSSGLDMLFFAPAGWLSDRWGRKALAVPCLSLLALGQLLVPLTHSLTTLILVGLLLGFGNGMGSGIVMTMGADLSPSEGRAAFLGVWRFIADSGTAAGPFVLSVAIAATSLLPAAVAVGAVGLTAATIMAWRMPEPSKRRRNGGSHARPEAIPDPAEE